MRAFGSYAFRVGDPGTFLRQLVATDPSFEAFEITNQLRNTIVSRLTDVLGQTKIPVLDLAGNYEKMSKLGLERMQPELMSMGLLLTQFYIENISLPPEVEQALDKRSQMSVLGDMNQYTRFQSAEAIRDAAQNPSGVAGAGIGIGAGIALGQQMAGAMQPGTQATSAPPPLPTGLQFHVAIAGKQSGPFDIGALAARVADGSVTRASLVWRPGMPSWVPADTVPELESLFSNVPPPLPG